MPDMPLPPPAAGSAPRPVVATIAVLLREGQVLLVRRANPPDAGRWGFPGGKTEFGETIQAACLRELREETGVEARAHQVVTAVDALDRDAGGGIRHHYVLVAVLCSWVSGEPVAADDALEARWFAPDALERGDMALSLDVARLARLAAGMRPNGAP